MFFEEDKEVHVGKPSLLKFNGENFCGSSAEDAILDDVTEDSFFL